VGDVVRGVQMATEMATENARTQAAA
jgi:hypothetical protein